MKVEIWSDFSCPFCYIGKTRFEQVLAGFAGRDEVEVVYRSFHLSPDAPPATTDDSYTALSRLKGIPLEQARQIFMQSAAMAKEVGLTLNYDILQMTNTYKAHRLAKWARSKGLEGEFSRRVFDAYFTRGKNIHDDAALLEIVGACDLDTGEAQKVLAGDAFADVVDEEIAEARELGISSVPLFAFDREYAITGAQPDSVFLQALQQEIEQ